MTEFIETLSKESSFVGALKKEPTITVTSFSRCFEKKPAITVTSFSRCFEKRPAITVTSFFVRRFPHFEPAYLQSYHFVFGQNECVNYANCTMASKNRKKSHTPFCIYWNFLEKQKRKHFAPTFAKTGKFLESKR